jgi:hypothetical protein
MIDMSTESKFRNEARRAPLSGRPCLRQYQTKADVGGLIDKETFQRMYEEKWSGAPWLDNVGSDKVINIDHAPASSPSSSQSYSPSSSTSGSAASSRRTTLENEYFLLRRMY